MDLKRFFTENPAGAVAFSGGTDSALLVWAAAQYGQNWRAYYLHTAFQPAFELADARKIAAECGLPLTIVQGDILSHPQIAANPADRCYHCKRALFSALMNQAAADGYSLVIDGTNASDDGNDRPGMRALGELGVRSPLRECGLTKSEVRALSREAGLFTWSKPAYACLATRIPTGQPITEQALRQVERGENILFSMGFQNFRLRLHGQAAVLQLPAHQMSYAWDKREQILQRLGSIFPLVTLDLAARPQ